MERKFIETYDKSLRESEVIAKKKGLIAGIFGSISTGTFNFLYGIAIYYAIYLLRLDCHTYNPSNLIPAFFCIITAGFAFGQAFPFLNNLGESKGAAKRVFAMIDSKSIIDVFENSGRKIENLLGDVQFENVHFSYPQRPDSKILNGLNLKIDGGKTVALVGSRYIFYLLN
jgi:ABC-type multidrug transport system fused ATPase/permease subunit